MPNRVAGAVAAALLTAAISVAHAAGMPEIGSKNFVPGAHTPVYLTNENLAVAPGSQGQSPLGTAYNEPASPLPSTAATRPALRSTTAAAGRPQHARLASPRMLGRHATRIAAHNERARHTVLRNARGGRTTRAAARPLAGRHGRTNTRHAAMRLPSRRG
ncbi:MAG: hypothetical protein ACREE2_14030 [Stellaceae bacterium]